MASVVLAAGTSHGPMLSIEPARWDVFAQRDPFNPELFDSTGRSRTYDDLVEENGDRFDDRLRPDLWQQQYDTCQAALTQLSEIVRGANLDYLVIVGNDQREAIFDDNLPTFLIGHGVQIVNRAEGSEEKLLRRQASTMRDMTEWAYSPSDGQPQPGAPELARHLINEVMDDGFDPAVTSTSPNERSVGHAFGFVLRRLLGADRVPTVPIMINTFYPPNQPSPRRCVDFGVALRDGIESLPGDARVGVIASGGLSHHVIDEELDAITLAALHSSDLDALREIPSHRLNGGSSEIRNWMAMTASADGLEQAMSVYEPAYRNAAGIGGGMGFAAWVKR